ncbi:MAG: hypothetical protein ACKE51_05645 [Methylococcaceae bacterium]
MIIGSIAAILIFVWFYKTAENTGRNPLHWAVAGFVVYFIVALIWTYFINPSIKDAAMHSRSTVLMYVVRYAYIVVSVCCAVVFNLKVNKKAE